MPIYQKEFIVIVSGYSTGRLLPYLFKGLGYECIHVNAHPHMPARYTVGYSENSVLYAEDIHYHQSIDEVVAQLQKYQIKCVIPGTESGVLLADALIERLNLPTQNDPQLSLARRDKYLMQKKLESEGINCIPSFLVADKETLFKIANKIKFPVVLKPIASSDAEGVSFCYTEEQLGEAFINLIGKKDLYSQSMQQLLVQKKMEGREFVVNSVSWEGKHFITDIWSNDKQKNGQMYDYQDLINPNGEIGRSLCSYMCSVLNALGIRFGAGHSELIWTETGPVLIEIGARIHGDFAPSCTMEVLGYNQLSVLAQVYLYPKQAHQYFEDLKKWPFEKKCKIVSMISNFSGEILDSSYLNYFSSLSSFFAIQHSMRPGKKLYETISLMTSPGNIFLIGDHDQLINDYHSIRLYEKEMYSNMVNLPLNATTTSS